MRLLKIFITVLFAAVVSFSVYVFLGEKTDHNAPVISCDTDTIEVSVKDGEEEILKYVTASDKKDGDITSDIIIESISSFVADNRAKVTFTVCDSDNNVTKLEKDLVYTDYTNPVFSIAKQQVYYTGASKVDLLDGVTAEDVLEGDISSRITIKESLVDLSQPGVYPVTYRVTTSKGSFSEITVNVYVYDGRLSESIILKNYLVYTDINKKINPETFLSSYPKEMLDEDYSEDYKYELKITDETNYQKSGTYYVTYRLVRTPKEENSSAAEILGEAYLAVAVRG